MHQIKKNVAIVTGGNSGESVISMQSAEVVFKNIDLERFNPFIIVINQKDWFYKNDTSVKVDKNDFSMIVHQKKINFDVVFVAIHGTPGENGLLQAYFDMLNIPYTSCGMLTSAITFNKNICNILVEHAGVMVGKYIMIGKNDTIDEERIIETISLPCFVKPNKGGSSIGVSKVTGKALLKEAIFKAFEQDDEVMVQTFMKGREITCGVALLQKKLLVLPLTEIVSKNEFFDFDAKYAGKSDEITPAPINEKITEEIKSISAFLFKELKCRGFVRFDYIVDDNSIYFLEVNTVPGMSENSLVPQQLKNYGILLKTFFSNIIDESLS